MTHMEVGIDGNRLTYDWNVRFLVHNQVVHDDAVALLHVTKAWEAVAFRQGLKILYIILNEEIT